MSKSEKRKIQNANYWLKHNDRIVADRCTAQLRNRGVVLSKRMYNEQCTEKKIISDYQLQQAFFQWIEKKSPPPELIDKVQKKLKSTMNIPEELNFYELKFDDAEPENMIPKQQKSGRPTKGANF